MNFKNILSLGVCVLALTTLTACNPDDEIPEPVVTFQFQFPTDAERDLCNPEVGGTKESCLTLSREKLFGVAYTAGIGKRGDAGIYNADCVIVRNGDYDNGKGPTPSYWMYVQGQFLLKAQYGRYSRQENDARNQLGIAERLIQLISTDQCRF